MSKSNSLEMYRSSDIWLPEPGSNSRSSNSRSRWPKLWVLAALLSVCGSGIPAVLAQGPPGGFPGPGGPGGPGGPFRMMMAAESSPLGIAGIPEVQAELKFEPEQIKRVEQLLGEQQETLRSLFDAADLPGMMELEPAERDARMAELRRKIDEAIEPVNHQFMESLNETQRTRLQELRIRREGPAALRRSAVADELQLTADQKSSVAEMLTRLEPRPPQGGPGFGPPDPNAAEAERRRTTDEILSVLSPEQREQWQRLQGRDFRFPEPRMFGGGMPADVALRDKFDANQDGWLNAEERVAARVEAKRTAGGGPGGRRGFGGPPGGGPGGGRGGGPPGMGGDRPPAEPGVSVQPADVASFPDAPLYDPAVLRTLFLEFEGSDWEAELADFKSTDVEIPATLTVDGKSYAHVGVSFRGASSFMMIPAGYKRSLNLTMDLVEKDQRLYGAKTLNLLNSNGDPTFMHSVLYSWIARQYLPTPDANLVRVVINGEDWGIYQNVEQFNKDFVKKHFDDGQGVRWKVPGSPGGGGSLAYLGDDPARYRRLYEIKNIDQDDSWQKLIELCRVLNQTPVEDLPAAIEPLLDVDQTLRFLAVDCALINSDGYWVRASDYNLYLDSAGQFHLIPHDMNEAFAPPMGPGGGGRGGRGARPGGPGGDPGGRPTAGPPEGPPGGPPGGPPDGQPPPGDRPNNRDPRSGPGNPPGRSGNVELDPLIGLDDASKPLRSKLLAVPQYREKYLDYVEQIARESLDWDRLGPVVASYRQLIEKEVALDTRKLSATDAFFATTSDDSGTSTGGRQISLREFVTKRRDYLLKSVPDKRRNP